MSKCMWCGREFEGLGCGDESDGSLLFGYPYCSRRCYEEAKASARQRQESLDREAQSMGYANYSEFRQARNQNLRDIVDIEAKIIENKRKIVMCVLAKFEDRPVPTIEDIRRFAETFSALSDKLPKGFAEDNVKFIWIDEDGQFRHIDGLSDEDADYFFGAFIELIHIKTKTEKIKRKNEDIKVSREATACEGVYIFTNDVIEYLIAHSQGIEDIMKPLLEKIEKQSSSRENNGTLIYSGVAIATAFISVLILNTVSEKSSFWGGLFAYAALCSTIISTGFRRKNVASLVVTFVLPAALYLISGMLRTQHFYSMVMFKMSLLASLLAIIPAVKNFRKTKFSLDTKLSETDTKKASAKSDADRDGSGTVGMGLIAVIFIFIARAFSRNLETGAFDNADDEMGAFFWAALFLLASLLAPGYSFAMPKSIHNRPSANIVLIIEAIAFGYFSLPYFQGGHYVTAVIGLIGSIMSVIGLAKSFISKK